MKNNVIFVKNKDFGGGAELKLQDVSPFVRYAHFLPINNKDYDFGVPFDNRLFFVFSGSSKIEAEGRTFELCEGDAIIIPSGVGYKLASAKSTVTYLAVNFDYTRSNDDKKVPVPPLYSGEFSPNMRFESLTFTDAKELNSVLHISDMRDLSSLLISIEQEYSQRLLGFDGIISGMMTEAIIKCVRTIRKQRLGKMDETVKSIISYMKDHLSEPLTNKRLAASFNLHPNYLSTLIKKYTGMPLHQYLFHLRISEALILLASSHLQISEVARRCGFGDVYQFSKAFKKSVGVSPSKYR